MPNYAVLPNQWSKNLHFFFVEDLIEKFNHLPKKKNDQKRETITFNLVFWNINTTYNHL